MIFLTFLKTTLSLFLEHVTERLLPFLDVIMVFVISRQIGVKRFLWWKLGGNSLFLV
jgi:hypothetical protein